ncbi:MAG: hypothetical protein M1816_000753 [Peltula sp. TS41687]|nr:MAG: hypothetical protein M1816_000753 [Peltula sp. TS41687]
MSTNTEVQPTPKEANFMLNVLANQDGNPKVNWNKVAEAMGLKNAATASARFGQIKKRLGWTAKPDSGPSGGGGNASTTAGGGQATVKSVSGSGTNFSPSKVTKPRGRPAGKSPKKGKGVSASTAPVKPEPAEVQQEDMKVDVDEHEADGDADEMKDEELNGHVSDEAED